MMARIFISLVGLLSLGGTVAACALTVAGMIGWHP